MTTLFENYEQQYSILTADITSQIGLLTTTARKDRRQLISNIEKHVEEAQELLEQMDLEVRELDTVKKQRCKNKLECYRVELKRLTLDYIKARSVKQESLYDSAEDGDVHVSFDQRETLLDNCETLERTGRKLNGSYRLIIETEEIGNNVMRNLAEQRETIQRSRNRLRETDEEVSRSSRILSAMWMRAIQQKMVLFFVAACFLILISLGVYYSIK